MEFQPVKHFRMVEAVIERIEEQILSGAIKIGERLPSEEQLSHQLNVGRRPIREALKVLEAKGLIDIQMGIGAIVQRNDFNSFLDALSANVISYFKVNHGDLYHAQQFRWLIEGAAFDNLLAHPDQILFSKLKENLEQQRKAYSDLNYINYQAWHYRFHCDIVESLGNPMIYMIYQQVLSLLRSMMIQAGSYPEVMERAINDHFKMINAVQFGILNDLHLLLDAHLSNFVSDLANLEKNSVLPGANKSL